MLTNLSVVGTGVLSTGALNAGVLNGAEEDWVAAEETISDVLVTVVMAKISSRVRELLRPVAVEARLCATSRRAVSHCAHCMIHAAMVKEGCATQQSTPTALRARPSKTCPE